MSNPQDRPRIVRTPEQKARDRQMREALQNKPTPAELLADPDAEGPFQSPYVAWVIRLAGRLRLLRESIGLSLTDLADQTGQDSLTLEKMEKGQLPNPPMYLLWLYSRAVGISVDRLLAADLAAEPEPATGT